jgi:hypothetical protein
MTTIPITIVYRVSSYTINNQQQVTKVKIRYRIVLNSTIVLSGYFRTYKVANAYAILLVEEAAQLYLINNTYEIHN